MKVKELIEKLQKLEKPEAKVELMVADRSYSNDLDEVQYQEFNNIVTLW